MPSRRRRHRYSPAPVDVVPSIPAGTNVWTFPKDLTNAVWAAQGLNGISFTADAVVGPDGTLTVDKVIETAINNQHGFARDAREATVGRPQTVAFYAAPAERNLLTLRSIDRDGTVTTSRVNLTTGVVEVGGHTVTVVNMGRGFFYVKATLPIAKAGLAGSLLIWAFNVTAAGGALSYQGVNGSGLYLWDLQYYSNDNGAAITPAYPIDGGTNRLRVTLGNWRDIGGGPDPTQPNVKYGAAGPYQPTVATVGADVDAAILNDVVLLWNLAGARAQWAPGGAFSLVLWKARIDRFKNDPKVRQALTTRQAIVMAIDEPQHPDFGSPSTITPTLVNAMGLYIKSLWPGAIVCVRQGAELMVLNGWSNVAGESVPPVATGWSGIDYGMSQYLWTQQPTETFSVYFAQQKTDLNTTIGESGIRGNLGLIAMLNIWAGGNYANFDNVAACWDIENNGTRSGVIVGVLQNSGIAVPQWTHLDCGDARIGQLGCRLLVASPAWLRKFIDAIYNDPDIALVTGYTHAGPTGGITDPQGVALETRSDIRSALVHWVTQGAQRTVSNGWRTIK